MEQSMRELVERAKSGDQQAIAALYEKTNRKAYYLSMQLVKDQDQAQDILQDAYLKVFTNLNMLQQPENFQGWLDTIVINKSKDYLKKKKPVLFSQMAAEEEPNSCLLYTSVKNPALIHDDELKAAGASGVMHMGKDAIQVVIGPQAESLADEMNKYMGK